MRDGEWAGIQAARYKKEVIALLDMLIKYGKHLPSCLVDSGIECRGCTCGWTETLAQIEQRRKKLS